MRVTDIRAIAKTRYQITVEGQLTFVLYKGELSRYCIVEDGDISQKDYLEITEKVLPLRAKKYAMNLLVKKDYAQGELREKILKAGYPEEIADIAIEYVKSYGYIDDLTYAKKYIETYQDREGKQRLRWKLVQKGIDRELIDEALELLLPENNLEIIINLIEKRLRGRRDINDKERQKLTGFLMRRGFSNGEISSALREYLA